MELELTHLVAPQRESRAVVALDPQLDAEGGAETRRRVERCRRVAERDSREPVDGGRWVGHDGVERRVSRATVSVRTPVVSRSDLGRAVLWSLCSAADEPRSRRGPGPASMWPPLSLNAAGMVGG